MDHQRGPHQKHGEAQHLPHGQPTEQEADLRVRLPDELDQEAFWQIHRGTIVNLRAIGRVDRDWRDQPVIVLKGRDGETA